jgi:hypothetical protein
LSVQDTNGNGIIDKQEEVDPNKGPLLPRGWKKFGEIVGDWK